jgi:hypothetical protein
MVHGHDRLVMFGVGSFLHWEAGSGSEIGHLESVMGSSSVKHHQEFQHHHNYHRSLPAEFRKATTDSLWSVHNSIQQKRRRSSHRYKVQDLGYYIDILERPEVLTWLEGDTDVHLFHGHL